MHGGRGGVNIGALTVKASVRGKGNILIAHPT